MARRQFGFPEVASGGGGGLGAGGAIFVQQGGKLTDLGSTETNTSAVGGANGLNGVFAIGANGNGLGVGQTIFLQGESQMLVGAA